MQDHHQTKSLLDVAEHYIHRGYSVIPIRENKTPISSWKINQSRRDDFDKITNSITTHPNVAGIGIVTGSISRLAVLDFDDLTLYDQFKDQFPQLTQTFTVRTRRGFHLYFEVDSSINTQTQKYPGVDWLYDGCYVVAPPSQVNGHLYQIEQAGDNHKLSQVDLNQIESFLRALRPRTQHVKRAGQSTLLADEAIRLYKHLAPHGRNNALFRVSLLARDHCWSPATTERTLLEPFITDTRTDEKPDQRQREGQATITSAFSRPARQLQNTSKTLGLPNTIREALLAKKLTCVVRTLEALRQNDIQPGQTFSETEARDCLSGIVGNHSIRKTLTTGLCRYRTTKSKNMSKDTINNCLLIRDKKSKLIHAGRKTRIYTMPSNQQLAKRLKVELTNISDPLAEDDLSSAKNTRQAMHKEFLIRRPGIYPSRWLAKRLSVSIVTKNNYDNAIPVHKIPTYKSIPITYESCGIIPEDNDTKGMFLEDDTGKRYPAKIGMAKILLKRGRGVVLKFQSYNFYYVENQDTSPAESLPALLDFQMTCNARLIDTYPQKRPKAPFSTNWRFPRYKHPQPMQLPLFPDDSEKVSMPQKKSTQSYTVPLKQSIDELTAVSLHSAVCDLGQKTFTIASARRLVDQYGVVATRNALKRLKAKKQVTNPAGLLTVIARDYQHPKGAIQ